MKNYKIVISGAAGFIGRKLVERVVDKYGVENVLALVWNKGSDWEKQGKNIIKKLRVDTIEVDLAASEELEQLKTLTPDILFHLAATTDTSEKHYSVNDKGTENLINSFKSIKKVVYTSTIAFFSGRSNCKKIIKENDIPAPSNEYGRSKLRAENFLSSEAENGRFELVIIRLPTVYGENPRKNSFLEFFSDLVKKRSLLARFNWPGLTSLVHVNDVTNALIELSSKTASKTRIYNMGTESITLAQASKNIHNGMGIKYRSIRLPETFWLLCRSGRKLIYASEKFMPAKLYNLAWRATLVCDNVFWCDAEKIKKITKTSNWVTFSEMNVHNRKPRQTEDKTL